MQGDMDLKNLIAEVMKKDSNSRCFDCEKHNPTWFSIRHAVFVCTDCAAKHRSIGLRLKSVLLDTFTKEDIKRAQVGGNFFTELSDFPKKYQQLKGLPEKVDKLLESYKETPMKKEDEKERKLVVKERVAPKFGTKVAKAERLPKRAATAGHAEAKETPKLQSVCIKQEEVLVTRKEYKVVGTNKSRIGLGISKVKEEEKE